MVNKLATAVVVAALAGVPFVVAAQQGSGPGPRGRGEGRGERMAEYLGLTDEQKATWKSLHEQHKAEMQPLRQQGRELHQGLREAMDAPNPDAQVVGEASLALKAHREKVRASRDAFEKRLTGILTPEQKTKFEAFKAARGHRGPGGRRGPGGGKPAGGPPEPPTEG